MPIFDTFTKRLKRLERAGQPDVYQYDSLPEPFRVQVIHIWGTFTAVGNRNVHDVYNPRDYFAGMFWGVVQGTISRELGVFALGNGYDDFTRCQHYLLNAETNGALSIIEASLVLAQQFLEQQNHARLEGALHDAIIELNHRFREHSIGYQFENGQIIRVDSYYVHNEALKPALHLLHQARFSGAEEEFLRAHEHYRQGRNKEAIADALKAFESTMKTICDIRKWPYDKQRSTARELITIVFNGGLVPRYLEQQFSSMRQLLESGVPTVRNKTSGHGQGATPTAVPEYMVAYILHLTASNIVFLVEAHNATK